MKIAAIPDTIVMIAPTRDCVVDAVPETLARLQAAEVRHTPRVWLELDLEDKYEQPETPSDLLERVQQRAHALLVEDSALMAVFPDDAPQLGPTPVLGTRMHPRRT